MAEVLVLTLGGVVLFLVIVVGVLDFFSLIVDYAQGAGDDD